VGSYRLAHRRRFWLGQALDALVRAEPTGLHVRAVVTLVLAIPFADFWLAVWRKHRQREVGRGVGPAVQVNARGAPPMTILTSV